MPDQYACHTVLACKMQLLFQFLNRQMGMLQCFRIKVLVYIEWASRVILVTIFGDLYQNKLWVICNNLNQFAHLSSASGPSNDVIKMVAIVLLMYTYNTSYLKQ